MRRLPLIAAVGAVCSMVVLPATGSTAAAAASTVTGSYQGKAGSAKRLTQAATISSLPKVASAFRNEGPRVFSPVRPHGTSTVGAAGVAAAGGSTMGGLNGVLGPSTG
jgi:hypothetical protein